MRCNKRFTKVLSLLLGLVLCGCSDDNNNTPADSGPDSQVEQDAGKDAEEDAGKDMAEADQAVDQKPEGDAPAPDLGLPYPAPTAYWSMDTADISGSTINDRAGSADGTIEGAVKAEGKVGDGLALDGTNDFVGFGNVLDDVFSGADKKFTISMWVKPTGEDGNIVLLAKNADASCDPDEDQRGVMTTLTLFGNASLAFQPLVKGSPQLVTTEQALPADAWLHLVFVYDGSADGSPAERGTIYVAGQAVATKGQGFGTFPFDIQPNSAHLGFGVRLSSSGQPCAEDGATFFTGIIDELAIWSAALTASDVSKIHDRAVAGETLM